MPKSVVLERAKRAANVLLIQAIVCAFIGIMENLSAKPESVYDILSSLVAPLIGFALMFILIDPLKRDKIESVRIIYALIAALYAIGLVIAFLANDSSLIVLGLIDTALYVVVLIALYHFGNSGKVVCYLAAGLSLMYLAVSFSIGDFIVSDLVSFGFSAVFYVFLGQYIESKGQYVEEVIIEKPTAVQQVRTIGSQQEAQTDKYAELERLKELMDKGVITPAEYEEKKKQILGL